MSRGIRTLQWSGVGQNERHGPTAYGATVVKAGDATGAGRVVTGGSDVATISEASGSSRICPASMLVGVDDPVGLHDRLDRQAVGGGDLAQRVALLDLVEARLRGRRRHRGRRRSSWSTIAGSVASARRVVVVGAGRRRRRRAAPTSAPNHCDRTGRMVALALRPGRASTVPAMPDADVTYPGAQAPDRHVPHRRQRHRPGHVRVGRRRRAAAARRPRRLRLRPDVRRLRPAAGRCRVARRQLGPARPRRQRPRRAVLVGRRPARRPRRVRPRQPAASPVPVIGHSKGGGMMIQLADAQPYRIASFVNLDGIPYQSRIPDVAEHIRTKMMADEVAGWLEHRRRTSTAARASRARSTSWPTRRARMNPRLSPEWLRYLAVGRRPPGRRRLALEDRPDDALRRLRPVAPGVDAAATARAVDAVPRRPRPPARGDGLGHRPGAGAARSCRRAGAARSSTTSATSCTSRRRTWSPSSVLDHVGSEPVMAHHARRAQPGDASPCTSSARATGGRCCCSTGSARRRPTTCRRGSTRGPGPVAALDFTGHGRVDDPASAAATRPRSCSPTPTSPSPSSARRRVFGRGLGAYIALMLAGSRPADVVGAILADGPGLAGGATFPTSQSFFAMPPAERPARSLRARRAEPRPAPARLRRGVRPPRARRLAARRADHRVRRVPPAVAGGVAAEPGVAHSVDRRAALASAYAAAPERTLAAPCLTSCWVARRRGVRRDGAGDGVRPTAS